MEKYGRTRQATDRNIIWRMRFACWITKERIQNCTCIYNRLPEDEPSVSEHVEDIRKLKIKILT